MLLKKAKKMKAGLLSRKQEIRRREAKFEKYNRLKGERGRKEPDEKRKQREEKLERFSKPEGQKLRMNSK
jgi:hypothetical protein